jgi:hypothetical protein
MNVSVNTAGPDDTDGISRSCRRCILGVSRCTRGEKLSERHHIVCGAHDQAAYTFTPLVLLESTGLSHNH